tara:strand:+ start:5345 stop:7120 length:1776 start_codon:yes stop_codon:yes gene_type:complete
MKILKLLDKTKLSVIFLSFLIGFSSYAEEQPADIWNIDKENNGEINITENSINDNSNNDQTFSESSIYKMQSQKEKNKIELDQNIESKQIKIVGLYDPEDYGLDINIWINSDGDQLKNIFSKLNKMNLSKDASDIMKISILTNAYYPQKNITEDEFLKFKSDWLIKNSDLSLIEQYSLKNQIININPELIKYLINQHLSQFNLKKACEVFSKNSETISDDYLSKFNIYCLIRAKKIDEAQLILDLKKESGFNDEYFEDKINFLLGYETKNNKDISEKNILDFHLAHQTNSNFSFEPKNSTDKIIWQYLSSANLLSSFKETKVSDLEKISTIETAVHNKNYPEKDLLDLYKRFQFNINQLLNANDAYKSLSDIEARALIYQKILLESEMIEKLKLLKILKNLFEEKNIGRAFDIELKKFLEEMDPLKIPDNLTSFYYTNISIKKDSKQKIKFNNDVLHQSKLINYFNGDYSSSKIERDVNNFLKKVVKNKKYFLSKKDIILLDSLKSDGVKIDKKFNNLYKIDTSEIPSDLQVMINNNEKGAALLRIVEVIGQDDLERIDEDTMYFIISTLNQLDMDYIRNRILLKVLPLKV